MLKSGRGGLDDRGILLISCCDLLIASLAHVLFQPDKWPSMQRVRINLDIAIQQRPRDVVERPRDSKHRRKGRQREIREDQEEDVGMSDALSRRRRR